MLIYNINSQIQVVDKLCNNYTLSHIYVSKSFSVIIQKIVYLRQFPLQMFITDSSGYLSQKSSQYL